MLHFYLMPSQLCFAYICQMWLLHTMNFIAIDLWLSNLASLNLQLNSMQAQTEFASGLYLH